jgi:uncharacterized protein YqjF (DUF2071 family)
MPSRRVLRPVMRQTWRDLSFIHWPCDASLFRRLIPSVLDVDLYEGQAWIGLVPFTIADLTHPRAPALPWISYFPETNLRTYVVDKHGSRGIWFFSLDAARLPAVLGARAIYGLPYFWARMSVVSDGVSVRYSSHRLVTPTARTDIEIRIGDAISQPSELELFLTARFRLYAQWSNGLRKADVEHPPWELRRASILRLHQDLVETAGLSIPDTDPLVHFGGKVDVLVGRPESV